MDLPPGASASLPGSSSSSRASHRKGGMDNSAVPEGSPLPPDLIQSAVQAKPSTFDAKEQEKRPSSTKSRKKTSSRRSSRRRSKTKKTRLSASSEDLLDDDDDDDGSVFSISSLGSSMSSSTNRTSHSAEMMTMMRAPYPKRERNNDFLNDMDDLAMEAGGNDKSMSEMTLLRGNLARIKSSHLESVPLEESLVPPSGIDENGVAASPTRKREESTNASSQHSRASISRRSSGAGSTTRRSAISHGKLPPQELNMDVANEYMFSERTPKSYSMAMNDWVMRQMGDNAAEHNNGSKPKTRSASSNTSSGSSPRLGDGWDSDKEDDRSRHVRDIFARMEETGITPPTTNHGGVYHNHKNSSGGGGGVLNSIRSRLTDSVWKTNNNDSSAEERVAMTTNIAPAASSSANDDTNNHALAVVCENDFPPGEDVCAPPRRNIVSRLLFGGSKSSAATMAYLRDNVEQQSTDRTTASTGADGDYSNHNRPAGVFRNFGEHSIFSRGARCDWWFNQRRLAILLLGSILVTILALTTVLIVQYNKDSSSESAWESRYGPRSEPTRPNPSTPPEFVDGVDDPNQVTTPWKLENLKQLLGQVTPLYELNDPNTPQGQAMAWLDRDVLQDKESYLSEHRVMQRYVLATLYYSTTGDNKDWFVKENWLSSQHECTWFGIMCGDDGSDPTRDGTTLTHEVTYINLRSNDLHGPIPKEIAKLRNLTQLHLNDNFLSGNIPTTLSELSHLHTLFMDYNYLDGEIPAELNDLTSLVNVDLGNNSLEGSIPNLEKLTNLVYLRLNNNNLSGEFPESLDRLLNVEVLTMGNNGIRGTLPVALEEHQKLRILHLHENRLEGAIPECKSPVLEEIHLDNNEFTGSIPYIVEAKRTPTLRELRLERNKLSGSIPLVLSEMYKLEKLWLDDNNLTGKIPHELGRLESLKSLRLLQNDLSGTVPGSICSLRSFSLSTFQATCDGSNPSLSCSCCTRCTW